MADIFISYSSKDKEKADQLSELLTSAGLSVWIDQSALEVSTSWSAEIVDAINSCSAFIVLLSPNSIESHNVIKEVSLASEKRKKILPLDLEPITLPRELEYQLAGIHRAPMSNIDSIIRALSKLGLEATSAPQAPKIVKKGDGRKSLMILPFEDMSPTGDNGWFSDGIVSELIAAFSNVKSLRLSDSQATKEFKQYRGQLSAYARETGVRYFIQGDVRKFGDQIKINVRLLDIETGDHLWQESIRGTMSDVFQIQEQVAEKVVGGLKLHLTEDEKKKLSDRGTQNAEAYELLLRAKEFSDRETKEGYLLAIQLYSDAIGLDPAFVQAYAGKASMLCALYRNYAQEPAILETAKACAAKLLELKAESEHYHVLGAIYLAEAKYDQAFAALAAAHEDGTACGDWAYALWAQGEFAKALDQFVKLHLEEPESSSIIWNCAVNAYRANNPDAIVKYSALGIPIHRKRLRLHPEDQITRWHLARMLDWNRNFEEGLQEVRTLQNATNLDSRLSAEFATFFYDNGMYDDVINSLQVAHGSGYRLKPEYLQRFSKLAGNAQFDLLAQQVSSTDPEQHV